MILSLIAQLLLLIVSLIALLRIDSTTMNQKHRSHFVLFRPLNLFRTGIVFIAVTALLTSLTMFMSPELQLLQMKAWIIMQHAVIPGLLAICTKQVIQDEQKGILIMVLFIISAASGRFSFPAVSGGICIVYIGLLMWHLKHQHSAQSKAVAKSPVGCKVISMMRSVLQASLAILAFFALALFDITATEVTVALMFIVASIYLGFITRLFNKISMA